jgi:hypothetical protein
MKVVTAILMLLEDTDVSALVLITSAVVAVAVAAAAWIVHFH